MVSFITRQIWKILFPSLISLPPSLSPLSPAQPVTLLKWSDKVAIVPPFTCLLTCLSNQLYSITCNSIFTVSIYCFFYKFDCLIDSFFCLFVSLCFPFFILFIYSFLPLVRYICYFFCICYYIYLYIILFFFIIVLLSFSLFLSFFFSLFFFLHLYRFLFYLLIFMPSIFFFCVAIVRRYCSCCVFCCNVILFFLPFNWMPLYFKGKRASCFKKKKKIQSTVKISIYLFIKLSNLTEPNLSIHLSIYMSV